MKLDPFYPIFDHSRWLAALLPLGIKLLQLRIKDQPDCELRTEIQTAKSLCARFGCQLVINDYWQLALDLGCDFIHLGQADLEAADVPAIKAAGIGIGISTHSDAELERALSLTPDYVALGPVYPTILKKMPWAPQGLGEVGRWKKRIGNIPLVGIGGIDLERAQGVLRAGADSVSVVTDITLNADPEARVRHWIASTSAYRKT
ncbi:MAG: Thiamin-phosphate pyrophosphorylase (EC 2.5.1.3) [Olavius algarvensis Gamma 3 endosymbiont]|nr:MAG: Thiamin-phosphate pyrophosphorylase (EC 2.5.1.3) [Olavius algarvensis Gamma 3 endosymbiont]